MKDNHAITIGSGSLTLSTPSTAASEDGCALIYSSGGVIFSASAVATEAYVDAAVGAISLDWSAIQNKPATFPPSAHTHDDRYYTESEIDSALSTKADLVGGKVTSSQLPSYVDDVVEYSSTASFPGTGETGKIYVALDANRTYRWSGSTYIELTDQTAVWGSISGTLSSQSDLNTALAAKATDSAVVHIAGTEAITGAKSFNNPVSIGVGGSVNGVLTLNSNFAGGNNGPIICTPGNYATINGGYNGFQLANNGTISLTLAGTRVISAGTLEGSSLVVTSGGSSVYLTNASSVIANLGSTSGATDKILACGSVRPSSGTMSLGGGAGFPDGVLFSSAVGLYWSTGAWSGTRDFSVSRSGSGQLGFYGDNGLTSKNFAGTEYSNIKGKTLTAESISNNSKWYFDVDGSMVSGTGGHLFYASYGTNRCALVGRADQAALQFFNISVNPFVGFSALDGYGKTGISFSYNSPIVYVTGKSGYSAADVTLDVSGKVKASSRVEFGYYSPAAAYGGVGSIQLDGGYGVQIKDAYNGTCVSMDQYNTVFPGLLQVNGSFKLPPKTVGTLPSASAQQGIDYRLTDRGEKACYSDGTNWLFRHDNSIVS